MILIARRRQHLSCTTSEPSYSILSNSDQLNICSMYQPLLYFNFALRGSTFSNQYPAMASSTPTTSVPIQEPVFQQFIHDVHHAYLLLHRAMALLPPTMIPDDIEPTPLPSTGVWNQPEGFQPEYSDATNTFLDNAHLPSPDPEDEEHYLDDLMQYHLPRPHQHLAAPSPDALPEPSKPSATEVTPAKKKNKPKSTPKVPAERKRPTTRSPSRSSSPLPTWTQEEKAETTHLEVR